MTAPATALNEGLLDQDFTLTYRSPNEQSVLPCWLALPNGPMAALPPLVAVHGIKRGAREQALLLGRRAASQGRMVIAPLFEETRWPRYQQLVRRGRADRALIALMDDLRVAGFWSGGAFELAGYSGGAQFAHRFAMLHPHLLSRLSVASSGWYTFPDHEVAFPYGLGARPGRRDDWGPRLAAGLELFLELPIQVCVGEMDSIRDANTRSGPDIDRQQGSNRLERAVRWVTALRRAALFHYIAPRVDLAVLPGCGHRFRNCVELGGLDRWILPNPSEALL